MRRTPCPGTSSSGLAVFLVPANPCQVQRAGRRGAWQEGKLSIHPRTPTRRNFFDGDCPFNTMGLGPMKPLVFKNYS